MQTTLLFCRMKWNKSAFTVCVFRGVFRSFVSSRRGSRSSERRSDRKESFSSVWRLPTLGFLRWYHSFEKLPQKQFFSSSLSNCQNFQALRGPPSGGPVSGDVTRLSETFATSSVCVFFFFFKGIFGTIPPVADWSFAQSGLFFHRSRLSGFESPGHKEQRISFLQLFF